jgi:hypothetical protein
MARSHSVLTKLLLEAKTAYMAAQEHFIGVFVSDTYVNVFAIRSEQLVDVE